MRKYENQGVVLIEERTKHTDTQRYDLKIISKEEIIMKAFSLTQEELNTVEKAFQILNDRRWGTIK